MPGPRGVITVNAELRQALQCEESSCDLASAAVAAAELDQLKQAVEQTRPDSNRATASGSFRSTEDTKTVRVDPEDPAKVIRVGTGLSPK